MSSAPTPNRITPNLTILRAENLKVADKSGTSDPYVKAVSRLQHGTEVHRLKTKVQKKTLNPVFNVHWEALHEVNDTDTLLFELWDKDTFGKDFLGQTVVAMKDIMMSGTYPFSLSARTSKDTGITGTLWLMFDLEDGYPATMVMDSVAETNSVFTTETNSIFTNETSPVLSETNTEIAQTAGNRFMATHFVDVPKRVNASALLVGNKLVILGGSQGYSKYLPYATVVDIDTKEVTEVEVPRPITASEEAFCCTIGDVGYFISESRDSGTHIYLIKSTGDSVVIETHNVSGAKLTSASSYMFISNGFQRGNEIYMIGENMVKLDTTIFTTEDNVNTYTWEEVQYSGDATFLNDRSSGLMYPFVYYPDCDEVFYGASTPEDSSKDLGPCVFNFSTSTFTELDISSVVADLPKSGSRVIAYKGLLIYTGGKSLMDDDSEFGPASFAYEYMTRNGKVMQRSAFNISSFSSLSDRKSHFMITNGSRIFFGTGLNDDTQLGDIWEITEQ